MRQKINIKQLIPTKNQVQLRFCENLFDTYSLDRRESRRRIALPIDYASNERAVQIRLTRAWVRRSKLPTDRPDCLAAAQGCCGIDTTTETNFYYWWFEQEH